MSEPHIQINGVILSQAQAMALRVAANDLAMQCESEDGREALGPIADGYLARLKEVIAIMHVNQSLTDTVRKP